MLSDEVRPSRHGKPSPGLHSKAKIALFALPAQKKYPGVQRRRKQQLEETLYDPTLSEPVTSIAGRKTPAATPSGGRRVGSRINDYDARNSEQSSEHQAHANLQLSSRLITVHSSLPGELACRRSLVDRPAEEAGIGDCRVRIGQIQLVKGVVGIELQLRLHPLCQMDVLLQGGVEVYETGADDAVVLQRVGSQYVGIRRQRAECSRVEVVARRNVLAGITVDDQIAKTRIVAAGIRQQTGSLPATDNSIHGRRHV